MSEMALSTPKTPLERQEQNSQERVFSFLAATAAHPLVHRIDTHGAAVFLEGDRALKIKRAIRFPYLDYSTLEKRKAACDEEIRINRQFAPQIYRRVVPITQQGDGSLSVDGGGIPVEFAVEMTRFDERRTIDHLAEAGEPDRELVDAIADVIAASHTIAPPAPTEPWLNSIPRFIENNTAAFRDAACFPEPSVGDIDAASQLEFQRIRGLLAQRGERGYVRRCHGDLHLANIVLIEHRPVLFDAIEFDPTIASVDVLYDLAFPLMDFTRYGRHRAANILFNRYLKVSSAENIDALRTLPLFMSLRAAIRANVSLARLDRTSSDVADVMRAAVACFELACRLIHPPAPTLVAIGGLSGTGKSVLARALASEILPLPGAVTLRSDVLRKQHFQVNETERLPAAAYEPRVTAQIYDALAQRTSCILAQGHSVVVDAVFARESERAAIREVARRMNVRFAGLFLQTDLVTRQSRVGRRESDASDATPEFAALQEKYNLGAVEWAIIDVSGTPEMTLERSRIKIAR